MTASQTPQASMHLEQLRGYLKHCENEVRQAEGALRVVKAKRSAAKRMVRRRG